MGKGTSKASVHPVVLAAVAARMEQADAMAKSVTISTQRAWQYPVTPALSPFDIPDHAVLFDRSAIGSNYAEVLADASNPGTTADALALKLQNDRIAVEERAFRTRHSSPIRATVHAAARRSAHAHPAGVFGGSLQKYLEDVIREGAV